jgi:hypothetical protein
MAHQIDTELEQLAGTQEVPDLGAVDVAQSWVRSMLPRIVALLAPLVLGLVTAALAKVQNWIGVDLQEHAAAYATFIGTLLLGGLGLAATWLFNAGQGQVRIAEKVVEALQVEAKTFDNNPVPEKPSTDPAVTPEVEEPPIHPH